jgi:alpha-tubulin suppressor-like RCC1 family protein
MQSRKASYGSTIPWSTWRGSRGLVAVLTPALVATFACGEAVESPTAPASEPALATAATTLSFRQVSAGWSFHTCGVTTDDRAYCWGGNWVGQLGDGTTTNRLTPVAVAGGLRFRQVSVGVEHTCGVTTDDRAFCWGNGGGGVLGIGPTDLTANPRPLAVVGGRKFRQVDAGYAHNCGLTRDSQVFCWGGNHMGQLGDGTTTRRLTPVPLIGDHSFRQVSAGWTHTCAVTPTYQAYCWGSNRTGELGAGTDVNRRLRPTLVAGGHLFMQVSAGGQQVQGHTCAVTSGGKAFCWGYGRWGQIGDGKTYNRFTPGGVAGGHSFRHVSAGVTHTCGVTTGERAYCWGGNFLGELGDGTTALRSRPVAVLGGLDFRQLDAGGNYTCGRTPAANAYCWGFNLEGQLGDGTTTDRLRPRAVAGAM